MKLRDKDCTATFELVTPNESWDVEPLDYLTYRQARKMPSRPYMSVQFARHLAAEARAAGYSQVKVHAHIDCSLNGRHEFPLIDPKVDLSQQHYGMGPSAWILPLPESEPGELY